MSRDSTIIYRSFYEAIKELPAINQAECWNAIFEFSLNFKEVKLTGLSKTIFTLIKPQLEANIKRYQSGNVPKHKQTISKTEAKGKRKVSETEANANANDNDNENLNEKDNENELVIYPSFEDFWNEYDKKHDRTVCEKKWGKLSQADKEEIMNFIPTYKLSQPDKTFRKNPEAFLNRRAWENEIVIQQTATQKREQEQIKNLGKTFYEYNKNSATDIRGEENAPGKTAIG